MIRITCKSELTLAHAASAMALATNEDPDLGDFEMGLGDSNSVECENQAMAGYLRGVLFSGVEE